VRAKSATAFDLTTAEAAAISGYAPEVIRRWIRAGKLPARRVPGRAHGEYRISRADLDAVIAGQPVGLPLPAGDDPLAEQIRRILAGDGDFPEPTDEQIRLIARLLPRPARRRADDDVA
jgi:excisionase family DNA binding protein